MDQSSIFQNTATESLCSNSVNHTTEKSNGLCIKLNESLDKVISKLIKQKHEESRHGNTVLTFTDNNSNNPDNHLYFMIVKNRWTKYMNCKKIVFVTNSLDELQKLKENSIKLLDVESKIWKKYHNNTNEALLSAWCKAIEKKCAAYFWVQDLLDDSKLNEFCEDVNKIARITHEKNYKQPLSFLTGDYEIIKEGKIKSKELSFTYSRKFKIIRANNTYLFFLSPLNRENEPHFLKFYKQVEFTDEHFFENLEEKLKVIFTKLKCNYCENFSYYTYPVHRKGCENCYHSDLDKLQCNSCIGQNISEMLINVFSEKNIKASTEFEIIVEFE